ncbi:MAG: hypothetical protein ACTSYF_18440 [Promethearchaeota archaeon]
MEKIEGELAKFNDNANYFGNPFEHLRFEMKIIESTKYWNEVYKKNKLTSDCRSN